MRNRFFSSERLRRAAVLAAVCIASAAMPTTFTGPAVATSQIADSFSATPAELNWITNAFMLAFGSCLMAAGALADLFGRKRLFLAGLGLFLFASTGLALAPGMVIFDVLRGAQGVAGAAVFAGGAAALAQEFDGKQRIQAFSLLGTSFGFGLVIGPVVAGVLTAAVGWRAIFILVIVMAALACLLAVLAMQETRDPHARRLDWQGALSFTLALTALTSAVLLLPSAPAALVDGLFILAFLTAVVFVLIELRIERPMLDLSLFRYPRFVGVQALAAAPAYAFVVLLILLPVRFTGIEGYSTTEAGKLMAAMSAPLLILPYLAGVLTRWLTSATICGCGLVIAAIGLWWLSSCVDGQSAIPAMITIGIGISLPWGLMDGLAVSVVPVERAGMATGIFSTTRVAGEGVALAIVSTVLVVLIRHQLPDMSAGTAAAELLAAGRLDSALQVTDGLNKSVLIQSYINAFSILLRGLAGVTMATALLVFLMLKQRHDEELAMVSSEGA